MFGFGAPPMPGRTLFERIDDALIKIPDHKIRHLFPLLRTLNDSNDSIFSEEGKVVREPFSCGCRGWSRGRKVDSEHNCAAVHGGQTGLPTEQTLSRLGMADNAEGRAVFPWPWPLLEQLRQWLSSYLGHLGKASSHRLLQGLRQRYPWLDEYVYWQGSKVVYRCPVPRHALRLAQQKSWFATHLPGHVLLIRQGQYWEVVVPPTTSAAATPQPWTPSVPGPAACPGVACRHSSRCCGAAVCGWRGSGRRADVWGRSPSAPCTAAGVKAGRVHQRCVQRPLPRRACRWRPAGLHCVVVSSGAIIPPPVHCPPHLNGR